MFFLQLPSQAQAQARYPELDNRDWRNRSAQLPAPAEERSWEAIRDRDFGVKLDPRQQDANQRNLQFARAQNSSNQGVIAICQVSNISSNRCLFDFIGGIAAFFC